MHNQCKILPLFKNNIFLTFLPTIITFQVNTRDIYYSFFLILSFSFMRNFPGVILQSLQCGLELLDSETVWLEAFSKGIRSLIGLNVFVYDTIFFGQFEINQHR